jgi:hypothetical protein
VSSSTINPFEVSAAVRPEGLTGPAGPSGWSLGVRHDPLLELLQVTVDGTNAGDLLDLRSGFLWLETINPAANSGLVGFVCTAVLSTEKEVYLPPDRPSTLVSATYRGVHPEVVEPTETLLTFEFMDGLVGTSRPVTNSVTYQGQGYAPSSQPLVRKLRTTPSCNSGIALRLWAPGTVREGTQRRLRSDLPAGQDLEFEVTAILSLDLSGGRGPQGWTIGVQHDRPFFHLKSATVEGTDVGRFSRPEARFTKTEIIDDEDGSGFTSAVLLSLLDPSTLPPVGDFTIARAVYRLAAPHDQPGVILSTPIRFADGLRGVTTPPVENIVPIEGKTQKACRQESLRLEVNVVPGGKVFARGDASNDGRINVFDAVRMVRALFFDRNGIVCDAAADSNGDLLFDTTDVIVLLSYLFSAGPNLPPPSPLCAPDPVLDDPLPCNEPAVRCR